MPATFTTILAQHITRMTECPAGEAEDGEVVKAGRIYVAPVEYHMLVEVKGTQKILRLSKGGRRIFAGQPSTTCCVAWRRPMAGAPWC